MSFDAILVLGGGVRDNGVLPPWAEARVARGAALYTGDEYLIALSAGTPHRPPPLDPNGYPVFEAVAAAARLQQLGVPAARILVEACSYDTIGNAYFARVLHTDPGGFRNLAIVTSAFHMPRTQRIFEWIFGPGMADPAYRLTFVAVEDVGIDEPMLQARREKEAAALQALEPVIASIRDFRSLHRWLFVEHSAYAANRRYTPATFPFRDVY